MSRLLTAGVLLRHPRSGGLVFLESGSELPEWVTGMVGDHALSEDSSKATAKPAPAKATAMEAPPTDGKGSGRDQWAAYAKAHGVEVKPTDGRDKIIAACNAAGVITDTEG